MKKKGGEGGENKNSLREPQEIRLPRNLSPHVSVSYRSSKGISRNHFLRTTVTPGTSPKRMGGRPGGTWSYRKEGRMGVRTSGDNPLVRGVRKQPYKGCDESREGGTQRETRPSDHPPDCMREEMLRKTNNTHTRRSRALRARDLRHREGIEKEEASGQVLALLEVSMPLHVLMKLKQDPNP